MSLKTALIMMVLCAAILSCSKNEPSKPTRAKETSNEENNDAKGEASPEALQAPTGRGC